MRARTILVTWLITMLVLVVGSGVADAALMLVERQTETIGATTITWDSSFEDLNYTLGETITMRVTWDVVAGRAAFLDFVLRGPEFTPKGPDPADGTEPVVTPVQDSGGPDTTGIVDVEFAFTALHCDEAKPADIGNAHFSLVLNIDKDGDGQLDSIVRYGVNVHVEDPGPCSPSSGRPAWSPGRPAWSR
jgi:hypothetical protein